MRLRHACILLACLAACGSDSDSNPGDNSQAGAGSGASAGASGSAGSGASAGASGSAGSAGSAGIEGLSSAPAPTKLVTATSENPDIISLAADESYVYWTQGTLTTSEGVFRVPMGGGEPQLLSGKPWEIVCDGGDKLYLVQRLGDPLVTAGRMFTLSKAQGASPVLLADIPVAKKTNPAVTISSIPQALRAIAGGVVGVDKSGGRVLKFGDDGALTVLVDNIEFGFVAPLAVDDDHAYFPRFEKKNDKPVIYLSRVPLAGGVMTDLFSEPGDDEIGAIDVSGTHIVWGIGTAVRRLSKTTADSGTPETIPLGDNSGIMQSIGDTVYVSTFEGVYGLNLETKTKTPLAGSASGISIFAGSNNSALNTSFLFARGYESALDVRVIMTIAR